VKAKGKTRHVVIRVEAETVARAERIRVQVEQSAGFRVTLSEVFRQALDRGLLVLERRARRRSPSGRTTAP
jgi:hypothetical protein